uniref:Ig-like domain-containing protein n=1 Tax=Erpetoichthys calabaricus TaxID=27687 RepID=A0A8C4S5F3_ERPCA
MKQLSEVPERSVTGQRLALKMTQEAISITKGLTKTARFTCKSDETVDFIHWYQHKDHEPPRRIPYITVSSGLVTHDDSGEREKFTAVTKSYTLALNKMEQSDVATYYCIGDIGSEFHNYKS